MRKKKLKIIRIEDMDNEYFLGLVALNNFLKLCKKVMPWKFNKKSYEK